MVSVEEHWLWYLTGAVDTSATMTINVQKDNRNNVGYILLPKFYFSRPTDVKSVFGMIDEYLENTTITYQIKEFEKSNRLEIQNGEDIRKFLDPIVDGFIQQRDRDFEYFLDQVLPLFENGSPKSEEKFIEAMEVVDGLAEYRYSHVKAPNTTPTTSERNGGYEGRSFFSALLAAFSSPSLRRSSMVCWMISSEYNLSTQCEEIAEMYRLILRSAGTL